MLSRSPSSARVRAFPGSPPHWGETSAPIEVFLTDPWEIRVISRVSQFFEELVHLDFIHELRQGFRVRHSPSAEPFEAVAHAGFDSYRRRCHGFYTLYEFNIIYILSCG